MSQKAGEFLRHDPIKLRFTTTHIANGTAKSILKRSLNQSIAEIMGSNYISPTTTVILYEKLEVSIVELETKRSLKIIWTGIHNREEASYPFLLPKTSMIHDLAEHLAKQVTLTPGGTGKIRVFEVSKDGKTQKEFTGTEMIGNIPDPVDLYAEVCSFVRSMFSNDAYCCVGNPARRIGGFGTGQGYQCIPLPQGSIADTRSPVPLRCQTRRSCWFGCFLQVPSLYYLQHEKFADTKKRLQARLGVSDKEFSKYRFALLQVATFKQPSYIEDGNVIRFVPHGMSTDCYAEDIIYDHKFAPEDCLGLDHVDRSGKTRLGAGEKSIVIRG